MRHTTQDPNLLKEALKKYHKENYYVQSWAEYQEELTKLVEKVVAYIKEHKISVDAVVPILRGGNVSGTVLAYALDVLTILPVQYKYFFIDGMCQLRRIHEINKELVYRDDPMFVLVEGNHCYGNQAKYAAKDLKTAFPKCRIIYGASNMDYHYQNAVEDAEVSLYGNLTNCCKELTDEECERLGIQYKKDLLFPWERIEEEWEIVELKQHAYANVDAIISKSPVIAEYDFKT